MRIIEAKQILMMSLYIGENPPNWPSIVHFPFKEIGACTSLSENHQEGEQIIFRDIRLRLNANNRTKTNISHEALF